MAKRQTKKKHKYEYDKSIRCWFVDGAIFAPDDENALEKSLGEDIGVIPLDADFKAVAVWPSDGSAPETYADMKPSELLTKILGEIAPEPEGDYDVIVNQGYGRVASITDEKVRRDFAGKLVMDPEDAALLDDVRPMKDFKKFHPKFDLDEFKRISREIERLESERTKNEKTKMKR